jgi:tocopherol O-methyltransferase
MDPRTEQTVTRNNLHQTKITDMYLAVMGEHFHWGYFENPDLSLAAGQDALVDHLATLAALNPQTRLLDVGCGVGTTALYLHQKYHCQAMGITNNQRGIRLAQERLKKSGFKNQVTFTVADALDNGFPANSFDVVLVIEVAYMIPDKVGLLRENLRVLKPGGTLLLCDTMADQKLSPAEMFKHLREMKTLQESFGEGKYETLAAYQALAEKAGFSQAAVRDIGREVFPTIRKIEETLHQKNAGLLRQFSAEAIAQFSASWASIRKFYENKFSTYGILHAVK